MAIKCESCGKTDASGVYFYVCNKCGRKFCNHCAHDGKKCPICQQGFLKRQFYTFKVLYRHYDNCDILKECKMFLAPFGQDSETALCFAWKGKARFRRGDDKMKKEVVDLILSAFTGLKCKDFSSRGRIDYHRCAVRRRKRSDCFYVGNNA